MLAPLKWLHVSHGVGIVAAQVAISGVGCFQGKGTHWLTRLGSERLVPDRPVENGVVPVSATGGDGD